MMDEQNYTHYNSGTSNVGVADPIETSRKGKDTMTDVKEKLSGQASEIKGKLAQQTKSYGTQLAQKIDKARGKTSDSLKKTSKDIHTIAMYVEEHTAQDMSKALVTHSKELVRKHPGKSLLIGLVAGVIIGRVLAMTMPIRRAYRI